MSRPLRIWVIFWLACLLPGTRAADFIPVASPVPLPEEARQKPIWAFLPLSDGRYVVSLENQVLLGRPNGDWRAFPLPLGNEVEHFAVGHGRILAAQKQGLLWVDDAGLHPLPPTAPGINSLECVPEGWLCGSEKGILLVRPDGSAKLVLAGPAERPAVQVFRIGSDVVAFNSWSRPREWRDGAFHEKEFPATLESTHLHFYQGGVWLTSRGVVIADGSRVLGVDVRNALTQKFGFMGALATPERLYFPSFRAGLLAYRPSTEEPEFQNNSFGAFYRFTQYNRDFLAGTTEGAFVMLDPARVRIYRTGHDFANLIVTQDGVFLASVGRAETIVGNLRLADDEPHPPVGSARYVGRTITFGNQSVELVTAEIGVPTIAATERAALVGFRHTVNILDGRRAHHSVPVPEMINSVATDGTRFYVGTHSAGVRVLGEDGVPGPTIGHGYARVRDLGNGRVILVFENGDIRDRDGNLLATIEGGMPVDAAAIQGKLLILLRRELKSSVIGELKAGNFVPLEMPGLGLGDPSAMVAFGERLYVAGRDGVLEFVPPFEPAAVPADNVIWSAPTKGNSVHLPRSKDASLTLVAGTWEPAHGPVSNTQIRIGDGEWRSVPTGATVPMVVEWGRTSVTVAVERNLLRRETVYSVIRPYPWWMRPWAWPLHLAVFAGVVWTAVRWRTRRLAARAAELERLVNERTASLVRSNAAKEEFLATVGHEIRNPLNGLLGIAHMLQDSDVPGREKNFLRVLAGCADQLRSMVDDVLDYSRIERGQSTVTAAPFEAVSLVEQSARVMDPMLESCALMLPETPTWLLGDSGKIRQIVCNLISNALKYGRPREAGVDLRLTEATPGRTLLRIAVRNTGPTIPPTELPRLFEAFKRGSNTGDAPGFGLGLAVCSRLCKSMGGRLTATSEGGNTEFVLELELAQCHEPVRPATPAAPVSRALAIEDETYNRIVLGHVLHELGFEVDWAPDGASALQLASRQNYDLILTDWRLPDIAGDELCRRLQRILGEPRPPIIAVTAYSGGEKFDAARAAGMAGFITKPITRDKLERLIRGIAGHMSPRRSLDFPARTVPASAGQDLRPSPRQLFVDIEKRWAEAEAQAELRDPRAARTAHALRSLLLLAGESEAAEQIGLLETNAAEADWNTVNELLPFLREEISAVRRRLSPP